VSQRGCSDQFRARVVHVTSSCRSNRVGGATSSRGNDHRPAVLKAVTNVVTGDLATIDYEGQRRSAAGDDHRDAG
jgi:hypothetical protein